MGLKKAMQGYFSELCFLLFSNRTWYEFDWLTKYTDMGILVLSAGLIALR